MLYSIKTLLSIVMTNCIIIYSSRLHDIDSHYSSYEGDYIKQSQSYPNVTLVQITLSAVVHFIIN